MADPLSAEQHRELGKQYFNAVWKLLDKVERTAEDDDAMIHMAHASRHHWSFAGTAVNLARGEWQVSRVYAVLGRAEPARYHAQRCLYICQKNAMGDFDLAYAFEALARAAKVAGDGAAQLAHLASAHAAAAEVADADDRAHLEKDLADL